MKANDLRMRRGSGKTRGSGRKGTPLARAGLPVALLAGLAALQGSAARADEARAAVPAGLAVLPYATLNADQKAWYALRLAAHDRSDYAVPPLPEGVARSPLAETLLTWDRIRREDAQAGFAELADFIGRNPDWPSQGLLRRRAELAIGPETPMAERLAYFSASPPLTAAGWVRLAEARASAGQGAGVNDAVRRAWLSTDLMAGDEKIIRERFAGVLQGADDIARLDALLWARAYGAAARLFDRLPADQVALARARMALRGGGADAAQRLAAVPVALAGDAGLALDRAAWLRRHKADPAAAAQALLGARVAARDIGDFEDWAAERLLLARQRLNAGDAQAAYRLVAEHQMVLDPALQGDAQLAARAAIADCEWTAGWIALRHLGDGRRALPHFAAISAVARTPQTLSRAWYWAGRAAEALNDARQAQAWYGRAAGYSDVFYGQLSTEQLGLATPPPDLAPPPVAPVLQSAFDGDRVVQATRLLAQLDAGGRLALFIRDLADKAVTAPQKRLVADLARSLERLDLSVTVARGAARGGINIAYAGYPQLALAGDAARTWALVHGITRQESLFNREAVSRVGARGLMQLMPGTARMVAAKLGLPYELGRLTRDPVYNVTLGSSYIQERLGNFDGNAVLAVASYNAGIGNVRKWLVANGDPRDPAVDVIDWIERIPFTETRNYVHRVLENTVVYQTIAPDTQKKPQFRTLSRLLGR